MNSLLELLDVFSAREQRSAGNGDVLVCWGRNKAVDESVDMSLNRAGLAVNTEKS